MMSMWLNNEFLREKIKQLITNFCLELFGLRNNKYFPDTFKLSNGGSGGISLRKFETQNKYF